MSSHVLGRDCGCHLRAGTMCCVVQCCLNLNPHVASFRYHRIPCQFQPRATRSLANFHDTTAVLTSSLKVGSSSWLPRLGLDSVSTLLPPLPSPTSLRTSPDLHFGGTEEQDMTRPRPIPRLRPKPVLFETLPRTSVLSIVSLCSVAEKHYRRRCCNRPDTCDSLSFSMIIVILH